MKTKERMALVVVLAMLAMTAALLMRVGANQRLGQPGLMVVNEPTLTSEGRVIRTNSVFLPSAPMGFASEIVGISEMEADALPGDTVFGRREYMAEDHFRALCSVVLMGMDRTSIHKPQYCLTGQGWLIERTENEVIPLSKPHPYDLEVMKLTTSKQAQDQNGRPLEIKGVYVYWFVADNQLTPHHGQRMWWMARDMMRAGVLQRWAYVTYFSICLPGHEEATFNRLKDLIAASVPEFQLASGPPSASVATAAALPTDHSREKH
jgi:hypothetical protein